MELDYIRVYQNSSGSVLSLQPVDSNEKIINHYNSNGEWYFKSSSTKINNIFVYDISGKLIEKRNVGNVMVKINSKNLQNGLNFIQIIGDFGLQTIKILNKNERTSHLYTNNAIAVTGSSDPSGPAGPFTKGGNLVKGFVSGAAKQELLHPKKFARVNPQIVDGFMMYPTKADTQMFDEDDPLTLTTSSVEYYFDILTDGQVDQKQACRGAQLFNKDSYYIDLEFECENEEVCADD